VAKTDHHDGVVFRHEFPRMECCDSQVLNDFAEEFPNISPADVDTFCWARIRTNIGQARIGMNGLKQAIQVTLSKRLKHALHGW